MKPTEDPRFRRLFEERGILPGRPDIVTERPYTPYRAGDIEALYAEDPKYRDELRPGQVLWIGRMVAQRDGVLMRRHAGLPESTEPWAQIRPYRPKGDPGLEIQRWAHRHPRAFLHKHLRDFLPFEPDEVPYGDPRLARLVTVGAGGGDYRIMPNPRKDGEVKRQRMNSRRWLDDHERHHPKGPEKVPPELRADWARGRAEGWHPHFWPWDAHLANEDYDHDEEVRSKFHAHTEYAKYLYAPADPDRPESGKERSAGIDVHPLAEELLGRGGRRVFYAIEGVLKNDAILAQGVPVFDTGSVTLWLPHELRMFAEQRLRAFEEVVVVPDSDWQANPQVSRQANRIADLLRGVGLDVVIAAPPASCGPVCMHQDRADRRAHKMGADDFLGNGGTMRQFLRLEVDTERAPGAIASKRRVALLLEHVISHADMHGRVYSSVDEIADAVGVDRRTIMSAIGDAEEEGLIRYTVPIPEPGQRTPTGTIELRPDLRPEFVPIELG